ncbi:MAG: BatA domain-containing protein [Gemmataceae bacterium]
MTFLSPWMLAGAAAVGIPIALHFFYKARYQRLPWAAMDFLKEAIEQTSRRLKFQEWILLALRCLVILLLALALARPGLDAAGAGGRGEAVDAVLVFDTSYSMGADDGDGKTRLDRAKEAALGVIESLPPKSTVQVILCGDRAENVGPKSRSNLDQARQLIPTIQTTGLSSDFLPGFAAAHAAAESGTAPVREVYLFSDLQKLGFERQQGALRDKCDELRVKSNLVFVRCGSEGRKVSNVAVTDVTAVGTIPHTKSRVPFVVSVKNTGAEVAKGIKVGLELAGKQVQDVVQVDGIEPGQVVPVTLTGNLDEAGPQVLTVRVSGDRLPGDNRFDRVIVVREAIRVLLVDGNPNRETPVESASHFVRTALTPVAQDRTEDYFVRPAVAAASEVGPGMLANYDIVYLLNAPAATPADPRAGLPADFVARLREFVATGGGLVIGGGDQVLPTDYNRVLGSGGAGLLPFDLTGEPANATETAPFVPAPESVEVPSFLAAFKERPFSDALRGVTITKLHPLATDGPGAAGGRVLVRTSDGKPFVTSRVVGEGEVVFVATTLDERWSNFPGRASDAFVPFTQYTLAHLTARKVPGGTRTAGEPLVWHPAEADGLFDLVKPPRDGEKDGKRVRLDKARADATGKLTLTATDTAESGLYRIVADGKPDSTGPVFAVNPDLRDSANLDVAAVADLTKLLGFEPAVIQAGAGTEAAVTQQRARREWTEYVLLLLLLAAVGESAWAWLCGRAW